MKKRTNKWWLALSVLAMCAAPALVACSDDDDEVTVVTPEIGISQFTISAVGGESTLAITPTADWQAESKTSWLALSPASGTVNDKEIKLTVQPNTTFESRTATIEMTVGTAKMTKTIVQEGVQKYISIYSDKITFTPDQTQVIVSPIMANVKVAVDEASIPAWISGVKITENPAGYYEAVISMLEDSYDDALRADTIVFKDADSDYKVKFPIECVATSMDKDYKVIVNADSGVVFMGARSFDLNVIRSAEAEQDTILVYMNTSRMGLLPATDRVSVSRMKAAQSAALLNSRYQISIENLRDAYSEEKFEYRVYVVSVYDVDGFKPAAATPCAFSFTQKNSHPEISAISYECTDLQAGRGGSYLDMKDGEATLTLTLNNDLCPDARLIMIEGWPDESNAWDPFTGCTVLDYLNIELQETIAEGNYTTKVYKITVSESGKDGFSASLYIAALSEPYEYNYTYLQLNGMYIMKELPVMLMP